MPGAPAAMPPKGQKRAASASGGGGGAKARPKKTDGGAIPDCAHLPHMVQFESWMLLGLILAQVCPLALDFPNKKIRFGGPTEE